MSSYISKKAGVSVESQIKYLEKEISDLKAENKNFEFRITTLERKSDTESEKTKMVFKILDEIKDNLKEMNTNLRSIINDLTTRVDSIEKKPAKKWDDLISIVIAVVVTAAVTYFLSK